VGFGRAPALRRRSPPLDCRCQSAIIGAEPAFLWTPGHIEHDGQIEEVGPLRKMFWNNSVFPGRELGTDCWASPRWPISRRSSSTCPASPLSRRRTTTTAGEEARRTRADGGLTFDGDGERRDVVDDTGEGILADNIGVLLALELSAQRPDAVFVADVK
jgi:hypothetical protein